MSFDSSRFTFNPWNDFFGVVMQQGRVQIDADWNEWLSELSRRIQAGALDTFGRAVVPNTTPHGFEITLGTSSSGATEVLVGPGRMYVDGLLVENHGQPAPLSGGWTPGNPSSPSAPPSGLNWDTALAELVGQNPIPINQQPYMTAAFPSEGGPYLVYLDVWQREVTYIEDPDLVEKAVGVDTTGRIQIVWQMKWIDVSNISGVNCSTPDSAIPDWAALLLPPGAQLSTGVVSSSQSGPCCLAPNTGYTGLENQLYRVEIHQPKNAQQSATFKWSRDNASVATGVTSIGQGGTSLVVQSTGRDAVLRFSPNDWVEITDDWQELAGLPGALRQVNSVTDGSSTITLYNAVSTADYPIDANGLTDPARHTRIRRWDQKGKIYKSDLATVWVDLSAPGATGDIPVPPPGTTLVLENGVTVSFNLVAGNAPFETAQFWNFAARSTDGTVEFLDFAPPRGIHHHYARLSVVDLGAKTASNCRTPWPPDSSADCCGCTVNIKPTDITGNASLQAIFDKYQNLETRTTFCLAAGKYVLNAPLRLTSAHSLFTIEACQPNSVILSAADANLSQFTDGLIVLDGCRGITLDGLEIALPATAYSAKTLAGIQLNSLDPQVRAIMQNLNVAIGLRTANVAALTVQNCAFAGIAASLASQPKSATGAQGYQFAVGIFASGIVNGLKVENNIFKGGSDFSAGFLHAPTANFVVPSQPGNVTGAGTSVKGQFTQAEQKASSAHALLDFFASRTQVATAQTQPTAQVAQQAEEIAPAKEKVAAKTTAKASTAQKTVKAQQKTEPAAAAALPPAETAQAAAQASPGIAASDFPTFDPGKVSIAQAAAGINLNAENAFSVFVPSSIHAELGGTVLPALLRGADFTGNTFSGLSIAVLILAGVEAIDLVDNNLLACHGGFWILTPADAFLLVGEPQELGAFGLSIAMGYPLPAGDTSKLQTVLAAPNPVRIYDGLQSFTDSTGAVWLPDTQVPGVTVSGGTIARPVPPPAVTGTPDQTIYQSERIGPNFTYTFANLAPGFYTVTLKLAEIFWPTAGTRIFDVSINGIQVINNLDLIQDGGVKAADDQTFPGIPSVNGSITITFTGTGTAGVNDLNAKSGGIQIVPQWSTTYLSGFSSTVSGGSQLDDLQNFLFEIIQLAQQGYDTSPGLVTRLRVEGNEMQRLTSLGLLVIGDDAVQTGRAGSITVLGNRMNMTLSAAFQRNTFNQASINKEAFTGASINYISSPFLAVAVVVAVNRCVVSNNMIINETTSANSAAAFHGPSLIVRGGEFGTPTATIPPPEVNVMANVLQGPMQVTPSRAQYLNNPDIVPPLNTWQFLNTVIP